MEASEAGRRIFWRHRWLLLILTILPVLVIVPLKERQVVTYAATRYGWNAPFFITSGLCLIAALLFLRIDATKRIA